MSPEAALALCRFAHDLATMLVWGTFAFLAALVPRALAAEVGSRLRRCRTMAIVLAVATQVAALPLEAAAIGDGWSDALAPATLDAVLFETSVGRAWQIQAVAALILVAAVLIPSGLHHRAMAIGAGLSLATVALTGHAAMHEGWLGALHRLNDAVHVLAGGAWLGALVPLVPILKDLDDPSFRREAGVALRRFSTVGHAAVALVIATGAANTALVLRRWPTDWSSSYQALLAVKITLVAVMTVLALVNRYALVPRIAGARDASVRALRRSTVAEVVLGIAVVALVATFGLLDPA